MVQASFVLGACGMLWRGVVEMGQGRGVVKEKRYNGFVKKQSMETFGSRELEDGETQFEVVWRRGDWRI